MNFPSLVLLLGLSILTACAALTVTLQLRVRRTSERLLGVYLLGQLFVLAPVYALGALSSLTSLSASLGTLAIDVIALAIVARSRTIAGSAALFADVWRALRADLAWYFSPSSGGMRLPGVLLAGMTGLVGWLTITCYFAPSFRGYDAPWYHEPITAFAIQEHGLHIPQLAPRLFYVASLARGSELLSAWLVLLSGSRCLIELPSVLGFGALLLGTYRLARVLGAGRERAVGWATVVVLTPGLLAYAQSTYVDLHACALLTATACFALTRPASVGSALLAAVGACLAISVKLYALGPAIFFACIAVLRLWRAKKSIELHIGTTVSAAALIFAAMCVALATPIRNAFVFGNPLYPVSVTVPFLHRILPGPITTATRDLEMTPPTGELLRLIFQPVFKYQTEFAHYVEAHLPMEAAPAFNYGYAMPVFGLGLAVLALGGLALEAVHAGMSGAGRHRSRRSRLVLMRLAFAAAVLSGVVVFFLVFPVTRLARYLGFVLACTGALAATAFQSRNLRRAGDMLLVGAIFTQLLLIAAQDPRLIYSPQEIWQLARMPPADRELARAYGAFASAEAVRFRDQALASGTVVLFGEDVLELGPLWNSTISNRLEFLAGDGDPTVAADARGATLVACTRLSNRCLALAERTDAWIQVGELYPKIISLECLVFRRRKDE